MSDFILDVRRRPFDPDDYRDYYDFYVPCDQGPQYINVDENIYEFLAPELKIEEFLRQLEQDGLGLTGDDQSFVLSPDARHKALCARYPAFRQAAGDLLELTQDQFEQGSSCFTDALRGLRDAVSAPSPYFILWAEVEGGALQWLRFHEFLRIAEPGVPYYIGPVVWTRGMELPHTGQGGNYVLQS